MPKEGLSSCCNAAVLHFKEDNETVCLACYHTTYVKEQFVEKQFEMEMLRARVGVHRIVGHLIFLIIMIRVINLILFLL